MITDGIQALGQQGITALRTGSGSEDSVVTAGTSVEHVVADALDAISEGDCDVV